ncbi:MAG: tetratricopeptide repeat protein, partial [bacterium]|nr:tetratricopeptide repeat protein [bacterium]
MRLPLLVSATLLVFAASTAHAQFDQIFGLQGTPTRGAITKMNRAEVTIDSSGREKTFPISDIKKVTLLDDPDELSRARDAAEAGRYEEAYSELQNVSVGADAREIVKQDIMFYRGYARGQLALRGTGDPSAAMNEISAFVKGSPQSFHYYDAAELLGDLAVATGDSALAETSYGQLMNEGPAEQRMRGAVLVAKAQQAQKKFADAKKTYEKVAGSSFSSEIADRQKLLASVGIAEC